MRRRTIIVLILLALFGLLVVLPYWLMHQVPPSCSDGKKNQNELGVDCGGACALICPGGAKDLNILWTKVFLVRDGVYDVAAYVENPNFEIAAPIVPYIAKLYDANGGVIAEEHGETYAASNERFAIFRGNMRTGDKVAVRGSIEIPKTFRWYTAKKSEKLFSVEDKVLVGSDRKPKLTALLKNDSPEAYRGVDVTVIIYDAKGNPVGVSSTNVEKIDKNSSEKLFFTWPSAFNYISETEQCDLPVDVVLSLDRSGSMAEGGKLEAAKISAAKFVDRLTPKDQAAYVSFATEASSPIDQPLTSDWDRVKRAIARTAIKQEGGLQFTNIAAGIQLAVDELASYRRNEEDRPVIVLLTDGLPTRPEDPANPANKEFPAQFALQTADRAKTQGIGIYSIGLGDDVDGVFLEKLSTSPEYYYKAASIAELGDVYQQIATSICKKGPSVIEIIPRVNLLR